MNIDGLKTAWQASVAQAPANAELDRLAAQARSAARDFQRGARRRLIFGSLAFALTLAMLLTLAFVPHVWPGMRVALALWAGSIAACGIGLWRVRLSNRSSVQTTLTQYLQASLAQIEREIAYQRALRWWFWLPFGIGCMSALLWQPPTPASAHPFVLIAVLALWVWGLIKAPEHWPQRLQPEVERLRAMLEQLPANDPMQSAEGRMS